MFGKKTRLRNIIDKHSNFFQPAIPKDHSPPPTSISDGHFNHDVALDISAEAFEKLLYGYIREIINIIPFMSDNKVPDDVIRLCLSFYNTGFENLKFNLYNTIYCNLFYDSILKSKFVSSSDDISCHRLFSTSIGYNIGIHKWKIQCVASDNKSISSPYGGIGIISDNKILKNQTYKLQKHVKQLNWINNKLFGSVYYWDQGSKCIYNYYYGRGKVIYKDINSWKKGDILTVILDCNRWKLKFLKNDKNISNEIDIKKKYIKYYPIIAFYHYNDTYRVINK